MPELMVSGVILAAGPSRRFGQNPPKQLAFFRGEPLIRRVVRQVVGSTLAETIVVVGMAAGQVKEVVGEFKVTVVSNPRFEEGQSTSVRAGLTAVDERANAAMFVPADQPWLTASVVDALVQCYMRSGASIVVPTFKGRRGAPVLFDRSLFGSLAQIEGDAGGRQILASYEDRIVEFELPSDMPLRDLDTLEDLRRMVE